jgi:hypothetical protein
MKSTCVSCEFFQDFGSTTHGYCTFERPTPTLIPDMEPPGLDGQPKQIMREVMLERKVRTTRVHCGEYRLSADFN